MQIHSILLKNVLCIAYLAVTLFSYAQEPQATWVKTLGSESPDFSSALELDEDGNTFIAGRFFGTMKISSKWVDKTLVSNGNSDVYMVKYNRKGEAIWAISFGGSDIDDAGSIALDTAGNIYMIGRFSNTVDFDPGTNKSEHSSLGSTDIFFAKFNPRGEFVWSRSLGGSSADNGYDITVDGLGNVICVGGYFNKATFKSSSASFELDSKGSVDFFILKFNPDGDYQWVKSIGGKGADKAYCIKTDPIGNIYIGGGFREEVDFDPGSSEYLMFSSSSNDDGFIAKYDTDGYFGWATSYSSASNNYVNSLCYSLNQKLYGIGAFGGSVDFNSNGNASIKTAVSKNDAFVVSLDTNGSLSWVNTLGSKGEVTGYGIETDPYSNVYMCGSFNDQLVHSDTMIGKINTNGSYDIYLSMLDSIGNFKWIKSYGSVGYDVGLKSKVNKNGRISVLGYYGDSIDFKTTQPPAVRASKGYSDVYLLHFSRCDATPDTFAIHLHSCDSVVIPSLNVTTKKPGLFIDSLENAFGCDSLIYYHVNIPQILTTVDRIGDTLRTHSITQNYQWIRCDSNNQVLAGYTVQFFVPSTDGQYAVIMFDSLCSDTSDCLDFKSVGYEPFDNDSQVKMWPNPTSSLIHFASTKPLDHSKIIVVDCLGRQMEVMISITKNQIDLTNLPAGVYVIRMETDGKRIQTKIFKTAQ